MPNLHDFPRRGRAAGRVVAVVLLATLAAGCVRPLAFQHEFFSPLNGTSAGINERARHAVDHHRAHHRALQAARHGCPAPAHASAPAGGADPAGGPDFGPAAARKALAELCGAPARPPVAAYGATSNAYRRWVEDRVRELPKAIETGAGAAGGS